MPITITLWLFNIIVAICRFGETAWTVSVFFIRVVLLEKLHLSDLFCTIYFVFDDLAMSFTLNYFILYNLMYTNKKDYIDYMNKFYYLCVVLRLYFLFVFLTKLRYLFVYLKEQLYNVETNTFLFMGYDISVFVLKVEYLFSMSKLNELYCLNNIIHLKSYLNKLLLEFDFIYFLQLYDFSYIGEFVYLMLLYIMFIFLRC